MEKLDEKLAKLDEQKAGHQEMIAAINTQRSEILAQKRQKQKRQHDHSMLLYGILNEKRLKSDPNMGKHAEELATMRSLVNTTFPKTRERDRLQILGYLDYLEKTLKPQPQETPDAESVTASRPVPQATPVAASIPRQDGLAGANKEFAGA